MWIKVPLEIRGKAYAINILYVAVWAFLGFLKCLETGITNLRWWQFLAWTLVLVFALLLTARDTSASNHEPSEDDGGD